MDYLEHTPIEVGRIRIDYQNSKAIDEGSHQDHEPANLRVMQMGWGDQQENRQVGLTTQDGMYFVAESGGFFGIFLSGRTGILRIPGWQEACIDDQLVSSDHSQADRLGHQA